MPTDYEVSLCILCMNFNSPTKLAVCINSEYKEYSEVVEMYIFRVISEC